MIILRKFENVKVYNIWYKIMINKNQSDIMSVTNDVVHETIEYHVRKNDLKSIFDKNTPKTKGKIMNILTCLYKCQKGLTFDEKIISKCCTEPLSPGYIYGYFSEANRNTRSNFKVKIGRTARKNFMKRIEEEQKGNMKFCFETKHHILLEKLAHLFFKYANEPNIDVNKSIEWFHFTEKTNEKGIISNLDELITDICEEQEEEDDSEYVSHFKEEKIDTKVKYTREEKISEQKVKYGKEEKISEQKVKYSTKNIIEQKVKYVKEEKLKSKLININTASKRELMTLSGIADKLSDRIINYRNENGRFATIDDIMNVPYIKEGRYLPIKNYITV
jgi:competence ComEA-like helix-hairpin-helix protein